MKKGKVFVGLSGGVDSAVSAALLKEQGFEVTGVFIKAWTPEGYPCTWKEDRRSAMKAAAVLDIPFITLDLEKEYKKEVVDYMIREYSEGKTPNPDVMCNKEIKFGHFLKFALENGADFVATGHYARKSDEKPRGKGSLKKSSGLLAPLGQTFLENFSARLLEGKDKNKDQSYFLWTLTQEQLKHVLFPVGGLQKEEVRKLAKKFGLPQATRKDSQGLCFLGKIDMKEFLSAYIPNKKGDVLLENGEVIGEHDGAALYTIGERHGFRITKKGTEDLPLYVVSKDVANNKIVVAPKITPHKKSQGGPLTLIEVNWICDKPDSSKMYLARIRYRQEKMKCKIDQLDTGQTVVTFDKVPDGISPGQSLVLYDGEICLGGGIIAE